MEILRTFLEQQLLLTMFLVIGLGYAVGQVNIRGFNLGVGAVLFVGLGVGMMAPKAAPPALLGSLGLVMFVYGIGIQYGKQFFAGLASPFGLKVNALALVSHLVAIGVCYVAYAAFSVAPAHVAGLFAGALTSTPTLQAAIGAVGNNDPALGYSVAYPFGLIAPILCMYFANLLLKPKLAAAASAGLELQEVVVRNAQVIGHPLSELIAALPTGVQVIVVRQSHQNRVPAPDIVLNRGDALALTGESVEALEKAQALIGESATGRIANDRLDLDYFRFFVSKGTAVGVRVGDLKMAGVSEHSIMHVRRGDADLLPRPDLILEYGDRVGVMARREDRGAVRAYFGDSIKSTAEFSYVSLGVGMALGVLLGILPIPMPWSGHSQSRRRRWPARGGAHPQSFRAHGKLGVDHAGLRQRHAAQLRPDDISCTDRAGVGAQIHRHGSAVGAALSGPGRGHHPHPDAREHARGAFHPQTAIR